MLALSKVSSDGLCAKDSDWKRTLSDFYQQTRSDHGEDMKEQAELHSQLGLYVPAKWVHDGALAINSFLHDKYIPMQQALSAACWRAGPESWRSKTQP